MKRILLLAALFTAATASFAQWRNNGPNTDDRRYGNNNNNNSALVLTTASNDQFTVAIDNGYQYQSNGNRVSIPNMVVGNHTVTVYETRRNIFGGQRQRVLFSGNVYFKPGVEHNMYINQNGQASFEERSLYQNGNYGNGGYGNNGNGKGWGYGRQKNKHNKHKNYNGCDDDRDDRRRW